MKTITLTACFACMAFFTFATTWTVTNSGFTFSPEMITIQADDTVVFDIENIHTVLEVSQETWEANGTTPLPGGFSLPLGGGMILPSELPPGTHYYVCEPHASAGMKGIIVVESATGTDEAHRPVGILIFPNPVDRMLHIRIQDKAYEEYFGLEIYDSQGQRVYARNKLDPHATQQIDVSDFADGMYILKFYAGTGLESRAGPVVVQRKVVVQ